MALRSSIIPEIAHISEHGSDDEETKEQETRKRRKPANNPLVSKRPRLDNDPPSAITPSIRSGSNTQPTRPGVKQVARKSTGGRGRPVFRGPEPAGVTMRKSTGGLTPPLAHTSSGKGKEKAREENEDKGEASVSVGPRLKQTARKTTGFAPRIRAVSSGASSSASASGASTTTKRMKRTREERERRRSSMFSAASASASSEDVRNAQGQEAQPIEISSDEHTPPPSASMPSSRLKPKTESPSKPIPSSSRPRPESPHPNDKDSSSDNEIQIRGGRTATNAQKSKPKGPEIGDEVIVISDSDEEDVTGIETSAKISSSRATDASAFAPATLIAVGRNENESVNGKKEEDVIFISDDDGDEHTIPALSNNKDKGKGKATVGNEEYLGIGDMDVDVDSMEIEQQGAAEDGQTIWELSPPWERKASHRGPEEQQIEPTSSVLMPEPDTESRIEQAPVHEKADQDVITRSRSASFSRLSRSPSAVPSIAEAPMPRENSVEEGELVGNDTTVELDMETRTETEEGEIRSSQEQEQEQMEDDLASVSAALSQKDNQDVDGHQRALQEDVRQQQGSFIASLPPSIKTAKKPILGSFSGHLSSSPSSSPEPKKSEKQSSQVFATTNGDGEKRRSKSFAPAPTPTPGTGTGSGSESRSETLNTNPSTPATTPPPQPHLSTPTSPGSGSISPSSTPFKQRKRTARKSSGGRPPFTQAGTSAGAGEPLIPKPKLTSGSRSTYRNSPLAWSFGESNIGDDLHADGTGDGTERPKPIGTASNAPLIPPRPSSSSAPDERSAVQSSKSQSKSLSSASAPLPRSSSRQVHRTTSSSSGNSLADVYNALNSDSYRRSSRHAEPSSRSNSGTRSGSKSRAGSGSRSSSNDNSNIQTLATNFDRNLHVSSEPELEQEPLSSSSFTPKPISALAPKPKPTDRGTKAGLRRSLGILKGVLGMGSLLTPAPLREFVQSQSQETREGVEASMQGAQDEERALNKDDMVVDQDQIETITERSSAEKGEKTVSGPVAEPVHVSGSGVSGVLQEGKDTERNPSEMQMEVEETNNIFGGVFSTTGLPSHAAVAATQNGDEQITGTTSPRSAPQVSANAAAPLSQQSRQDQEGEPGAAFTRGTGYFDDPLEYIDSPSPPAFPKAGPTATDVDMDTNIAIDADTDNSTSMNKDTSTNKDRNQDEDAVEEDDISAELMYPESTSSHLESPVSPVGPPKMSEPVASPGATANRVEKGKELVVPSPQQLGPESLLHVPQVPITEDEIAGRQVRSRSSSEGEPSTTTLRRSRRTAASRESSSSVTPQLALTPKDTPPRTPTPPDLVPRTFGGLPVMTWQTHRQKLRNSVPEHYLSRDLPHTFQDHINSFSPLVRNHPQMAKVFEIMVAEINARDEPDAPPITLFNNVDDEPTPPWEFHYTNKMWLGENVPPPSFKNLQSCDCVGKCDPNSKTCKCLKRQQELTEEYQHGFLYESQSGLLKQAGLPIFECNSLCGCDEGCMNRVVQNGRKCEVVVGKTKEKGWGVFNGPKEIPKGTFIGVYAGELLADEEAEKRGAVYNVFGRTYLFDIDFYHIRQRVPEWSGSAYTVDAYHAGNFTRFLNHSCDPNAALTPVYIDEDNWEKPLLTIFARRDIPPHDEITFSYSGDPDNEDPAPSPKKSKTKGKTKLQNDAVYTECRCGSRNCKGTMFGGEDDEDE